MFVKKKYFEPELIIEKFTFKDVVTESVTTPGWEEGDEEIEF